MGKNLKRGIDYEYKEKIRKTKVTLDNENDDFEALPKKTGIAHEGTWRYKRGSLHYKILERMLKKHVNEPYEVVYKDIAEKFKVGSLERLHLERDLVYMSLNEPDKYLFEGYQIIDGIIRQVITVKGVRTVVKG